MACGSVGFVPGGGGRFRWTRPDVEIAKVSKDSKSLAFWASVFGVVILILWLLRKRGVVGVTMNYGGSLASTPVVQECRYSSADGSQWRTIYWPVQAGICPLSLSGVPAAEGQPAPTLFLMSR